MIVDVHAHGLSEDFIIETAKGPGRDWKVEIAGPRHYVAADYGPLDPLLYDLEERLASLRSRRVVLQLICPPPPLVATREHAADVALTQRLNKSTAKLVADARRETSRWMIRHLRRYSRRSSTRSSLPSCIRLVLI